MIHGKIPSFSVESGSFLLQFEKPFTSTADSLPPSPNLYSAASNRERVHPAPLPLPHPPPPHLPRVLQAPPATRAFAAVHLRPRARPSKSVPRRLAPPPCQRHHNIASPCCVSTQPPQRHHDLPHVQQPPSHNDLKLFFPRRQVAAPPQPLAWPTATPRAAKAVTSIVKQAAEYEMLLHASAQTQAEEAIRDHLPCEVLRIQACLQRHEESLDSIHGQLSQLTRRVVQLRTAAGIALVQDEIPYSPSSVNTTQQPLPSRATAEPTLAIHVPNLPLSRDTQDALHVLDGMPVYDVYGAEDNCCPTGFINVLDGNLEQQQDEEEGKPYVEQTSKCFNKNSENILPAVATGFRFSDYAMDSFARSSKITNENNTLCDSMPVYDDEVSCYSNGFIHVFGSTLEQQQCEDENGMIQFEKIQNGDQLSRGKPEGGMLAMCCSKASETISLEVPTGFAFSDHAMDFLPRSIKLTNKENTLSDSMSVYDDYNEKDSACPDVFDCALEQQPPQADDKASENVHHLRENVQQLRQQLTAKWKFLMLEFKGSGKVSNTSKELDLRERLSPPLILSPCSVLCCTTVLPTNDGMGIMEDTLKVFDKMPIMMEKEVNEITNLTELSNMFDSMPVYEEAYNDFAKPLQLTQGTLSLALQYQLTLISVPRIWDPGIELLLYKKDAQMHWDPGKDKKKFNDLIPVLCSPRFNAMHYCQIFQNCDAMSSHHYSEQDMNPCGIALWLISLKLLNNGESF